MARYECASSKQLHYYIRRFAALKFELFLKTDGSQCYKQVVFGSLCRQCHVFPFPRGASHN